MNLFPGHDFFLTGNREGTAVRNRVALDALQVLAVYWLGICLVLAILLLIHSLGTWCVTMCTCCALVLFLARCSVYLLCS